LIPQENDTFRDLFVLEMANNHWGSLERGIAIIRAHGAVVRHHGVKAAIKMQFRDSNSFIHKDFRGNTNLRYVHKSEKTFMDESDYAVLADEIRKAGCIPMATPFDEKSVELCEILDLPIIKVSSADITDWSLLERIAQAERPVIVSSGGATERSLDNVVSFFKKRHISLAINHCVSLYPTEDHDLNLDQIDYLRNRYPANIVGLSTHEYHDWAASMFISYAKGARTWERHIDLEVDSEVISPYCSLPHQIDLWFRAYAKSVEMCGGLGDKKRVVPREEREYLDALVRGIYARKDVPAGTLLTKENVQTFFYFAIPLRKQQLSSAEVSEGMTTTRDLRTDEPLTINHVTGTFGENPTLRAVLQQRGV
jgi:sialic acid synthase SpsE